MHRLTTDRTTASRLTTTALTILFLLIVTVGAHAEEMTVDQVLENYYEAIGGLDAWRGVQSVRQEGRMSMMGMEAPFKVSSVAPNRMRMEFEMQGMTGIQAFDGEKGWMVMPFMGSSDPQPLPQSQIDQMGNDIDIQGVLVDWQEKGHQVELLGKEELEGTETYKVKAVLESGHEMLFFIDSEYFVPIATRMTADMPGMGEVESTTMLSDYKEVDGLMIPHSMVSETPMGESAMTLDKVEVNVEIDESIFEMPAKSEETAGGE